MRHGFAPAALSEPLCTRLKERRPQLAADVIRLTSLSASGHPGGSLSSLDALMLLYATINVDPKNPAMPERDRVVVSHGHISPGVYSTLADVGFFDIDEAFRGFRRAGSVFGGHIENVVPGVEWNTGNLGQGLSAGCGMAVAGRVRGYDYNVFVGMGDGEQQKGQISEARRFASRFKLSNLIAWIDVNGLQIGGATEDIMPFDLAASWRADGWNVIECDGHDFDALYGAFRSAALKQTNNPDAPTVILLRTVMGKGISFIENLAKFHGTTLNDEQAARAFAELGAENNLDALRARRTERSSNLPHHVERDTQVRLNTGPNRDYEPGTVTDCRSAYGAVLADLAALNAEDSEAWPVIGLSCDLEGSVKMNAFHAAVPDRFFEAGIAEHNTAVVAGAASISATIPFFSTFGMFGIVECYNQQRLNDQNGAAPRVVVTHCGMDVGEDGPTHQCIDYIPLAHNLFGFHLYSPADPNDADRILRYVAANHRPVFVTMGRSKLPVVTDGDGNAAFGGDYEFEPGRWPTVRPGDDAVIFAVGPMVYRAVEAAETLAAQGIGLRVVNAASLKPVDEEAILSAARQVGTLLTYEDHNVRTGLGALVSQTLGDHGVSARLKRMGVTRYGTSGKPNDLFAEQNLAPEDVVATVKALLQ